VIEVARQAGHSPTIALATYGHVIEELEGAERRPAEDVIRAARSRRVPSEFPQRAAAAAGHARRTRKVAAKRLKPSDGLEPSTPTLPWRFWGGNGGHGRALASTMCLQFGDILDVGRDRACPRVLGLVYPSRTRGLLSDHKTDNAPTRACRTSTDSRSRCVSHSGRTWSRELESCDRVGGPR